MKIKENFENLLSTSFLFCITLLADEFITGTDEIEAKRFPSGFQMFLFLP